MASVETDSSTSVIRVQGAVNGGFQTGDATGWTSFPSAGSTFTVTSPRALSTFAGLVTNTTPASSAVIKQSAVGAVLLGSGGVVTIRSDLMESSAAGGVIFVELFSLDSGGGVTKNPRFWEEVRFLEDLEFSSLMNSLHSIHRG